MNIISPLKATRDVRVSDPEQLRSSVLKILEGALIAIGRNGSRRLNMSDICNASGVSRGTLYRYFSTKDDVLAAVSEFVSTNFEKGVRSAAEQHQDPIERFRAVIRFFADFTTERTPDRIFEVEPGFHLDFFRSHFGRHKLAVREALDLTLNFVEQRLSTKVDRDGFAETLIRLQLSTMIVPAGTGWNALWEASPDTLERFILMTVGQPLVASPYS